MYHRAVQKLDAVHSISALLVLAMERTSAIH